MPQDDPFGLSASEWAQIVLNSQAGIADPAKTPQERQVARDESEELLAQLYDWQASAALKGTFDRLVMRGQVLNDRQEEMRRAALPDDAPEVQELLSGVERAHNWMQEYTKTPALQRRSIRSLKPPAGVGEISEWASLEYNQRRALEKWKLVRSGESAGAAVNVGFGAINLAASMIPGAGAMQGDEEGTRRAIFLEKMNIEPPVLEDGTISTEMRRDRSRFEGLLGKPSQFFVPPELDTVPAFGPSELEGVISDVVFGRSDPVDRPDGSRVVTDRFGGEHKIPKLVVGSQIRLPGGGTFDVTEEVLEEAYEAQFGSATAGSVSGLVLEKLFPDDYVDTPLGRWPVIGFTDNKELNRELMQRPEYQRAVIEAADVSGTFRAKLAAKTAGVDMLEFLGLMKATSKLSKLAGKGVSGLGARLPKRPVLGLIGKSATAMGKVFLQGGRRNGARAAGTFFDVRQIGEEVWFETFRGMVRGEGDLGQWVSSGVTEGVGELALGGIFRGVRKTAGKIGRSDFMERSLNKIRQSQDLEAGTRLSGWLSKYDDKVQAMMAAGADKIRIDANSSRRAVMDAMYGVLQRSENAEMVAAAAETAWVGWAFGTYQGAARQAQQDGVDLSGLPIDQKIAYVLEAMGSGEALGSALGFASYQGAHYGAVRGSRAIQEQLDIGLEPRGPRPPIARALTKEDNKEVERLTQFTLYQMGSKHAEDPEVAAGVVFLAELAQEQGLTPRIIEERLKDKLGLSARAGDVGAENLAEQPFQQVALMALDAGGPRRIAAMLERMDDYDIMELKRGLLSLDLDLDQAESLFRGAEAAVALIDAEFDRDLDAPKPDKEARKKRFKRAPREVVDDMVDEYFAETTRVPLAKTATGARYRSAFEAPGTGLFVTEVFSEPEKALVGEAKRPQELLGYQVWSKRKLEPLKRRPDVYESLYKAKRALLEEAGIAVTEQSKLEQRVRELKGELEDIKAAERYPKVEQVALEPADYDARIIEEGLEALREARTSAAEEKARLLREDLEGVVWLDESVPDPEPRSTVEAQMEALRDGRKPAVLITPGMEMPKLMRGERRAKIEEGTLIYRDKRALVAAREDRLGEALGYGVAFKVPTEAIVTARDGLGRVVADIEAEPTEDVVEAASRLAGEGGGVEVRRVEDALRERAVGRAIDDAPEFGGRVYLPTAREVELASQDIYEALRWNRENVFRDPQMVVDEFLREQDISDIRALLRRVRQAQRKGVAPPARRPAVETAPKQSRKPRAAQRGAIAAAAEKDVLAAEALAASLERAEETVAQKTTEAPEAQEEPAQLPERGPSRFWSDRQRKASFQLGSDAFRRSAKQEVYTRILQGAALARYQSEAMPGTPEAEQARAQRDSMIAGMLVSTGLPSGENRIEKQFLAFVAALAQVEVSEVSRVRNELIEDGARLDPLIDATITGMLRGGRRVISDTQLAVEETRDLLRVIAMSPPLSSEGRYKLGSSSTGPQQSLQRNLQRWLDDNFDAIATAAGQAGVTIRAPSVLADLSEAILRIETARKQIAGKELRDLRQKVMGRVRYTATGGEHKGSGEILFPGEKSTVSEVATEVVEMLTGEGIELAARGPSTVAIEELGGAAAISGQRTQARAEVPADYDAGIQFREAYGGMRKAARILGQVRVPGKDGAPTPLPGIELDRNGNPTRGAGAEMREYMRLLLDDDAGLRQVFEEAGMGDSFDDAVAAAKESSSASQDLARSLVSILALEEELDTERVLESVQRVDDLWDAFAIDRRDEVMPDDLRQRLSAPDEVLFPPERFPTGALEPGTGVLHPAARQRLAQVVARRLGKFQSEHLGEIDAVMFHAGLPIEAMLSWTDFNPDPAYPDGRYGARGAASFRNVLDWLKTPFWTRGPIRRQFARSVFGLSMQLAKVGRGQRSGFISRVTAKGNWDFRRIRLAEEEQLNIYLERTRAMMAQIEALGLTLRDQELLGMAIEAGAPLRVKSAEQFEEFFGKGTKGAYELMLEIVQLTNDLGQDLVAAGLLDSGQYERWQNRYLPKVVSELRGKDEVKRVIARQVKGLGHRITDSWSKSKSQNEVDEEFERQWFAVGYAVPPTVAREAASLRVWNTLDRMMASTAFRSGDEIRELEKRDPLEAGYWKKAAEPIGGGKLRGPDGLPRDLLSPERFNLPGQDPRTRDFNDEERRLISPGSELGRDIVLRRQKAHQAQIKLEIFLERTESGRGEQKMTEKLADTIARLRDGYITDNVMMELDLILDMMDPDNDGAGLIQTMSQQWRRLKTIQNPKHWMLNYTTSLITNHVTGKVSMYDFMRGVTRGDGLYNDSSQQLVRWQDFKKEGRSTLDLDLSRPSDVAIKRVDDFLKLLGGSTFEQTVFEPVSVNDLVATMLEADSGTALNYQTTGRGLFAAVSSGVAKRGRGQAATDRLINEMSGSANPEAHTEAIRALLGMYQMNEMFFKYAAYLNGTRNGMDAQTAAEWAAEGTGDYADRSPRIYRLTTRYEFGQTPIQAQAIERLGKKSRGLARDSGRLLRAAIANPFWMYHTSMVPTLGASLLNHPLQMIGGYAFVSMVTRAIAVALGDDDDLSEALAGRGDWGAVPLPEETVMAAKERYRGVTVNPWQTGNSAARTKNRIPFSNWLDTITKDLVGKTVDSFVEGSPLLSTIPVGKERYADVSEYLRGPAMAQQAIRAGRALAAGEPGRAAREIPVIGGELALWNDNLPLERYQNAPIGFLPKQLARLAVGAYTLAAGRKGETRLQTALSSALSVLAETSSPLGSILPVPGASALTGRQGQKLMGETLQAQTLRDMIRGVRDKRLESKSLAQRAGTFAAELVLPVRKLGLETAVPGEKGLARAFGIPQTAEGDELARGYARFARTARQQLAGFYTAGYEQGLKQPENIEKTLFDWVDVSRDARQERGQYRLKTSTPKTPAGQWILAQAGTDPDLQHQAIGAWLSAMDGLDTKPAEAVAALVRRREINPALVRQMVWATLKNKGRTSDVLELLEQRVLKDPDPDNAYFYYRMAIDSGLRDAELTGERATRRRRVFETLGGWQIGGSTGLPSYRKVVGPQMFERFPRQAISEMTRVPDFIQEAGGQR